MGYRVIRTLAPMVGLLAACASAPPPQTKAGPRGLRASEHLDAARQHDESASRQVDVPAYVAPDPAGPSWRGSWGASSEQKRLAEIHRSEAAALQAEYEDACGSRPLDDVAVSPLQRHATGGWPTASGMILYIAPSAGSPEQLLADIRCHRAWMMLAPSGMDDCLLDMPGLVFDTHRDRDGITLSIVVLDRKLVEELHRRAGLALEASAQLRKVEH